MEKINKKQAGFTLVELVVVAGLVGLLSIGLVNMFMSSVRGSQKARLQAEVKAQGDYAMVSMEKQLRNAIKLPTTGGGSEGNELIFTIIENDLPVDYGYRFSDGNILFIDKGGGATPLFIDPVVAQNPNFQLVAGSGLDPGSVKISFTLSATSQGTQVSQDFQTTVAIRTIK